ncbi:MAG: hypothetical protein QW478_10730 [Candidatus Micrarchaeaceae archaeon]
MDEYRNTLEPDWIYNRLLKVCVTQEERDYAMFHKFRFSFILKHVVPLIRPGLKVANIGLSIFDPIMQEIVEAHSSTYYSLVPNDEYLKTLNNPSYNSIKKVVYDVSQSGNRVNENSGYDIILFYETLEHLLAPDETILANISRILNNGGLLLGSVPNAASAYNRLGLLLGRNIYWTKTNIINGVFGGYGHIREYTVAEISKLLENLYTIRRIYGFSPYGNEVTRKILNVLPLSWRSVIFLRLRKRYSVCRYDNVIRTVAYANAFPPDISGSGYLVPSHSWNIID